MTTRQAARTHSLSTATKVNVAGILGFGATIVVQIAGGVDAYPVIPPGLVISLLVVGLLVLARRWRWTLLLGALWPVFLTVGAFLASGSMEALSGDDGGFVQVTSILQRLALAVALVAGVIAVVQRYRPVRAG